MKDLHLIVVGKLKDKNLLALEDDFLKRIRSPKLHIYEVKSHQENIDLEIKELENRVSSIEGKFGKQNVIPLTEHGKTYTSDNFSNFIFNKVETTQRGICFLIGGSAGFTKEFLSKAESQVSLSPMTLPHKIARLVFIEQIYRAITIKDGHPYHKA